MAHLIFHLVRGGKTTTSGVMPVGGEKKYYRQLPGGTMGASNTATIANESQGGTSIQHDYEGDNKKMRAMGKDEPLDLAVGDNIRPSPFSNNPQVTEDISSNPHGRYAQKREQMDLMLENLV